MSGRAVCLGLLVLAALSPAPAKARGESTSEPVDGFRTSRDGLGRAERDLPRRESLDWLMGRWTDDEPAQTCIKGARLSLETRALFSLTGDGVHGRVEKVSGDRVLLIADYAVTITDKGPTLRVTERGKSYRLRGNLSEQQMRFHGSTSAGRTVDIEIGLLGRELLIVHRHGGDERNHYWRLSAVAPPDGDGPAPSSDRRLKAHL